MARPITAQNWALVPVPFLIDILQRVIVEVCMCHADKQNKPTLIVLPSEYFLENVIFVLDNTYFGPISDILKDKK